MKAASPEGIHGKVLKTCADQLAPALFTIFNLSLTQSVAPTCFKRPSIISVPKSFTLAELNDYCPVPLTSLVIKCFIKDLIRFSLPSMQDPLQFAEPSNRSMDNALHTPSSHLSMGVGYARLLLFDYSSAFNNIGPPRLFRKLGLCSTIYCWVLNI